MTEKILENIKKDMEKAISLHQRATADYEQCKEFSKAMSGLLSRLEDGGCHDAADKVMRILIDCNPKTGSHCERSNSVSQLTQKLSKYLD